MTFIRQIAHQVESFKDVVRLYGNDKKTAANE